jgi:hypothetical protein
LFIVYANYKLLKPSCFSLTWPSLGQFTSLRENFTNHINKTKSSERLGTDVPDILIL